MLIIGGELGGQQGVDVRLEGGVVVEVAAGLTRRPGEPVIEAAGGAVLPGLHDHHVHLRALAAARGSVHVGPPQVTGPAAFDNRLREAAHALPPGGWVRAIGYHESVAGPLDRRRLDAAVGDRPVRVQHRSGALWILNTAALAAVGLAAGVHVPGADGAHHIRRAAGQEAGPTGTSGTGSGPGTGLGTGASEPGVERDEHGMPTGRETSPIGTSGTGSGPGTGLGTGASEPGVERDEHGMPTGRLWRLDRWLASRVPTSALDLAAIGRNAAEQGVTGFTDADPTRTRADVDLLASGGLPQRLVLMSAADLDPGPPPGRWTAGPRKLLLDDATLPPLDELAAKMAAAHASGEPVAVHCVTRLQLVVTVAALAQAGPAPGDRIEHGAVIPTELHGELRRLGVTVVTQPNFVAERGDQYRAEVDPDDLPVLYPCASLRAAGIAVAAGTDAPFGGADPWAAVRVAIHRRTPSGAVLGPRERVDPATALGLFLGRPDAPAVRRCVEPGAPADLCILDRPLAALATALTTDPDPDPADRTPLNPVALTLIAGTIVTDRRPPAPGGAGGR